MVYCGPPSKGCGNCRDRKIRCDQREPGCGQCEKRQQSCPGYRNMVDLLFRDESSHVIKKAKARRREKTAGLRTSEPKCSPDGQESSSSSSTNLALPLPSAPTSVSPTVKVESLESHRPKDLTLLTPGPIDRNSTPLSLASQQDQVAQMDDSSKQKEEEPEWTDDEFTLPSPDAGTWPVTPFIARMYDLDPSSQERGMAFFFSRYVNMKTNASHVRFDFVFDIWKPLSPQLDSVMASMSAVGLVGISQLTRAEDAEEILDCARKSYGTALCLTNEALANEGGQVKDATMLSVLILGVYEMMAEPGLKTMSTWQKHIHGAVTLAKLRGPGQFGTRAGIRMFKMLCESVAISCMQQSVPMPEELVSLQTALCARQTQEHEPGSIDSIDSIDVSGPIYQVLQARHDAKQTELLNDLDSLLERMDAIEAEFDRTASSVPQDCRHTECKVTRSYKCVYRDACHRYPNLAAMSAWNWLRTGRMLVLETIMTAIRKHYPDPGEQGTKVPQRYRIAFREARERLDRVNWCIVASVPQHQGLLSPVSPGSDSLEPVQILTIVIHKPHTSPARPLTHSKDRGKEREADDALFDDDDRGGPSLDNPTRSRSAREEAERYMLLASASNAIIWPLFCVGMSSVCTPELKAYVVSRLKAMYEETGLKHARSVASMIDSRELVESHWTTAFHQSSASASRAPSPEAAPRPSQSSSSGWHDEVTLR